jgi:hypothetical protein
MPLDGARDAVIAVQAQVIGLLAAENARLAGQVADLATWVQRLERLASRNSGNSSMPPSAGDLPGRTPPARRKPPAGEKRRQGKQPGAPGSHLAWSEHPGDTVWHFPAGTCECSADLAGAADLGVVASHQQVAIPLASAQVIQHDLHAVACGCGRVHQAAPPAGAGPPGTVTYGLNLQAWWVFLVAAHAIPVRRCAGLIESLTGAAPSPGFVHQMIARAAAAVAQASRAIRALIILAQVICADETPIRVGPGPKTRNRYLLVACTRLLTCYFLGDRSLATFGAFVFPGLAGVVVVHDRRYQNYDAFPGIIHQLCAAHLLRDRTDAPGTYPAAIWPGQIADALRGLIHAASRAPELGLAAVPGDIAAPLIHDLRHGVLAGLSEIPRRPGRKQHPGRGLLECLRDRRDDVLRFVSDLRIPPTSNQAERDIRPAKVQQKISGRLRSGQPTRHRYAIRGYLSTAARHGISVLTALRDALEGRPWMPPIPDPP